MHNPAALDFRASLILAGQAEHWSNTAQNLLASAHSQLDAATMGLQDAATVARYRQNYLEPPIPLINIPAFISMPCCQAHTCRDLTPVGSRKVCCTSIV